MNEDFVSSHHQDQKQVKIVLYPKSITRHFIMRKYVNTSAVTYKTKKVVR